MFGLTQLGIVHTAISLIAVVAGLVALVRDRKISPRNLLGKLYVIATILTCLTGFGIFQHGGFNKAHVLGIITLVVLGIAAVAGYSNLFGRFSRYVETVSYSATFLFHCSVHHRAHAPFSHHPVQSEDTRAFWGALGCGCFTF
jgi:uncharacterized membrane protein